MRVAFSADRVHGGAFIARRRPRDDLGQHRVEVGRHFAAGFDPGIDAKLAAIGLGKRHFGEQARARLEVAAGVFGIEPRLDRVAVRRKGRGEFIERRQRAGR